mgnify:CR=1 FL=1
MPPKDDIKREKINFNKILFILCQKIDELTVEKEGFDNQVILGIERGVYTLQAKLGSKMSKDAWKSYIPDRNVNIGSEKDNWDERFYKAMDRYQELHALMDTLGMLGNDKTSSDA